MTATIKCPYPTFFVLANLDTLLPIDSLDSLQHRLGTHLPPPAATVFPAVLPGWSGVVIRHLTPQQTWRRPRWFLSRFNPRAHPTPSKPASRTDIENAPGQPGSPEPTRHRLRLYRVSDHTTSDRTTIQPGVIPLLDVLISKKTPPVTESTAPSRRYLRVHVGPDTHPAWIF